MKEPKLFDVTVLPTGLVTDPADPVESPTHIATARPLAFAWYADGAVHIDTVDKCDAEDLALRSLSALLSLIPAEQAVQAMGEETRQKFLKHFADAAAEELRAQGAVLPEAHSGRTSGEPYAGWVFQRKRCGHVSATPQKVCPECGDDDGTTVPLRACNGTGQKTEESDGQQVAVDMGRLGAVDDARGSVPDCVQPEARVSDTHPERPVGIPASATIWAEVVDGLGRKVGAWFVPAIDGNPPHVSFDDGSEDLVWWMPHTDHAFNDMPGKSFCTKVVAAQCRQLYERGMAEMEAIPSQLEARRYVLSDDGTEHYPKHKAYVEPEDRDTEPRAIIERGDESCHDGAGWYFWDESYPEDGSHGAYTTLAEAQHHAASMGYVFDELSSEIDQTQTNPRPACIPAHVADTDWTVIEGRAVWRNHDDGPGVARIQALASDPISEMGWHLYREHQTLETSTLRSSSVPQSLFLAARRWMGWEKEKTVVACRKVPSWQNVYYDIRDSGTLVIHYDRERNGGGFVIETMKETYVGHGDVDQELKEIQFLRAVDLSELREAWNDRGCKGYWARVEGAIEKLLSGGAP